MTTETTTAQQPDPSEGDLQAIEQRLAAVVPYEAAPALGDFECPLCEGDGRTEGVRYDAKGEASTVVAYGIGESLAKAQAWVEQAPKDMDTLLRALRSREETVALRDAAIRRLRAEIDCIRIGRDCARERLRTLMESLAPKGRTLCPWCDGEGVCFKSVDDASLVPCVACQGTRYCEKATEAATKAPGEG